MGSQLMPVMEPAATGVKRAVKAPRAGTPQQERPVPGAATHSSGAVPAYSPLQQDDDDDGVQGGPQRVRQCHESGSAVGRQESGSAVGRHAAAAASSITGGTNKRRAKPAAEVLAASGHGSARSVTPTQVRPLADGAGGLPAAARPGGAHQYSPAEIDDLGFDRPKPAKNAKPDVSRVSQCMLSLPPAPCSLDAHYSLQ